MTTKSKKKRKSDSYKDFLNEHLKDPKRAAGYLTECFHDEEEIFMLALKDVVEARGGIGALAKKTSLNREGLYDMLSEDGNPRLTSLTKVLQAVGLTIEFCPGDEKEDKEAA